MRSGIPNKVGLALAAAALAATVACGGTTKVDREVSFRARDYAFEQLDGLAIPAGSTVRFVMTNDGQADHEFEVFDPDGKAVDEIPPLHTGKKGSLTLKFTRPGTYTFVCGVSDHESRGMKGSFAVT